MSKGQTGVFEFIVVGIIFTISFLLITVFSIRYTIIRNVDLEYRFDSGEGTLLSILPITDSQKIPFIEKIGEKIVIPLVDLSDLQKVLNNN